MIKKVSKEESHRRILVISRLPRLVNHISTAVQQTRDDSVENVSFSTYDDLMQLLARRVVPDDDSDYMSFVRFDQVRYDCDSDSGISFCREFIITHLSDKERKQMATNMIEPLTLWNAIITIKSHAQCAITKTPLELDDYMKLPPSFGLTQDQRELCYDLFLKYKDWQKHGSHWDEVDRSIYVLKFGPSVFREDHFIPWTERVNQRGEMNLLDEDGNPLYPFFFDLVCADEAQDFTEVDIALFVRMSRYVAKSLTLSFYSSRSCCHYHSAIKTATFAQCSFQQTQRSLLKWA